ncbi:fimbria/pilus outer membrane usher protein [Pluralibacter gergoviae]|uniref:fimbria/pilus outer membrane usher protein n=1 Tax=Pluralibacter gergoviae TaxID=61647 RepID=UPI002FD94628
MKYCLILCLLLLCPTGARAADGPSSPALADDDEYHFSPELFRGGRFSEARLAQLTKKHDVAAGTYKLDLYLNGEFIDAAEVEVIRQGSGRAAPCLRPEVYRRIGIRRAGQAADESRCLVFEREVQGGQAAVDTARLRLNLSAPRAALNRAPRGYVDPQDLTTGSTIGFINYLSNYYHVDYARGAGGSRDSAWLSLNGGVNAAGWQYRQLSNLSWSREAGYRWYTLRSYLQKPLPGIGSQLMLGELVTSGRFFSGLSYRGAALATDDRMLPDAMRGYAPVIAGVAASNARVLVRQNGQEIYQTTVAPGAFEINDLYPTSYSGDLEVEVIEADGAVKSFSVPFSAVPESMRPGISRFNIETGRIRDGGDASWFGDLTWQRGLSNAITFNSGLRLADGYRAGMLGGVYSSRLGAVGLDVTASQARMPGAGNVHGWMSHLSWSKTFQPTGTTFSLAGYRYSTRGYRDLSDVLGIRSAARAGEGWWSTTSSQHSRFDISLSQSLQRLGSLFATGSTQSYRDGRSRDTQLQLGYGNSFLHGIGMNLTVGRQRSGGHGERGRLQTFSSLSFSLPLGKPTLSTSITRASGGGTQYQSSLSGSLGEQQATGYGLSVSHDRHHGQTTVGGNLQRRLQETTLGFNASRGDGYWQASANAQGALAIHGGGLTLGHYLSDTFALVEAKGAEGARVYNAHEVTIDKSGYALIPAVTPYRYNRITLDPQEMDGGAELIDSERRIAPVAGAAAKVVFRTRRGTAMLIKSTLPDGSPVPLGADVLDEAGTTVGMAGQGGQIYVRSERDKGRLIVRWGDGAAERCGLAFQLSSADVDKPMVRLASVCSPEGVK